MSRTDAVTYRQADPGLLAALEQAAPGAVSARATDRLGLAHDASHYLLTPQAVVTPTSAAQVAALLRTSARVGFPLTFRSGGTSLSGQGVSGSVLVDTRRHFRQIEVLDDGARVRVQPGATVRQVNARLAPYGVKLGPDPASESACTIGGVVANNSSGMACGTQLNSYRTLTSLVLVLPSGTVVDTSRPDAEEALRFHEPELHGGLLRLRDRVRSDAESCRIITQQFSLKNTMGYGLNSFLDHSTATQILTHLAVGSEGTLAFVAEATFRTVPVKSHAATALLVFSSLREANDALPALVGSGLATIELLDAASLRVAQHDPLADSSLRAIPVLDHAALLIEHQELSDPELDGRIGTTSQLLEQLSLAAPVRLSRDARTRAGLWHIRKGLYTAVAGSRPSGTTALLEDIAVPVGSLARTCEHLVELFARHGYQDSVIFGHAKDGNVHFMLTERFDRTDRYLSFTEDMVDLVLGENGTLKAEHGTGRIMAPFVRRQYGDELYEVMLEVKRLCDPAHILNPGVLLNPDPLVHVQHLKSTPTVEPEVDRCVECGYCEPVCPSKDLTLTPRQRIVLRREMVTARTAGDTALVHELESQYRYEAVDTCAVDGMCQTACPVLINTGDLVKRLRAQDTSRVEQSIWKTAAGHWDLSTRAAARSLDVAASLPPAAVTATTAATRRVFGDDRVPLWEKDVPRGGSHRRPLAHPAAQAVYLPSCTGTMFAPAEGCAGVRAAFLALCERAGVAITVPADVADLCCGTPWRSKGFERGYRRMWDRVLPALWDATAGGRLAVVSDAASCTEGFEQMVRSAKPPYDSLVVVDAVDFTLNEIVPRLTVERRLERLVLHPTCASTRLGTNDAMAALAALIADDVVVPQDWGCCAFAGDRGLLHPELTASATAGEAGNVRRISASAYASSNRTCEIGMTRATGEQYQHLLELVDVATRPALLLSPSSQAIARSSRVTLPPTSHSQT